MVYIISSHADKYRLASCLYEATLYLLPNHTQSLIVRQNRDKCNSGLHSHLASHVNNLIYEDLLVQIPGRHCMFSNVCAADYIHVHAAEDVLPSIIFDRYVIGFRRENLA